MIAVDLADYVHIKTKTDSKDITVRTDTGFLPCDERNLAFQAAKKLQQLFRKNEGVEITIDKNIPVSAGMGRIIRCGRRFARFEQTVEP